MDFTASLEFQQQTCLNYMGMSSLRNVKNVELTMKGLFMFLMIMQVCIMKNWVTLVLRPWKSPGMLSSVICVVFVTEQGASVQKRYMLYTRHLTSCDK